MYLRTLASGSSGNCALLSHGGAHLLIDAGISCRRITTALTSFGIDPKTISAVLITHEHTDHISGLATLTKKFSLPVYTSPGTADRLAARITGIAPLLRPVSASEVFSLAPFTVTTFPTLHDAAQPMGFAFEADGRKAAFVTDLGRVTPEVLAGVKGAHLLVCEANHDVDWLLSGPYPYSLKQRVMGAYGHLSNEDGARLALSCVQDGAHTVLLAHLSHENNTPAHALMAVEAVFRSAGVDPLRDVKLTAAPRNEPSDPWEV